ncbi:MAG: glycerate kinase [Lachnospiraceae bacterium]|nr:glycerate kinase [Lachnospiraceae bacterium]
MKLVFASDSFKGTLTSEKISELLTKAAGEVIGKCETVPLVLADGGEGTLEALLRAREGKKIPVTVHDPLLREIRAYYGVIGDEAVIEMAQASGLTLVPEDVRDPLLTSSVGTGELMRAALQAGYRKLTIAIGGSATNDGGMGAAAALGIRFSDNDGNILPGRGIDLARIRCIDRSALIPELKDAQIRVMCDVKNPLCGENGATYVYGPQKGASREALNTLEEGMRNYRELLIREFGMDPDTIEGAGAAGGMGAALKILFGAELKSGIGTILDIVHFDELIKGADVIISGEGRLDSQSSTGKAVQGVGEHAKKAGIACIALCGSVGAGYEKILDHGVTRIVTLAGEAVSPEYAMEHAEELYYMRAKEVFSGMLRS